MPSAEASRRNLAKAWTKFRPPRRRHSPRECQAIVDGVWAWVQSRPSMERRTYPACPRHKSRSHRFKAGRCACGYDRSRAVDANGYCFYPKSRYSARKLARQLGVSHTWVLELRRRLLATPTTPFHQEHSDAGLQPHYQKATPNVKPTPVNEFGQPLSGGSYHSSFLTPLPAWARRLRD
jgi:hypothetical protein